MFRNLAGFLTILAIAFIVCMAARAYAAPAQRTAGVVSVDGCL